MGNISIASRLGGPAGNIDDKPRDVRLDLGVDGVVAG